jgi:Zn-dependent alcohol dehydrogenase
VSSLNGCATTAACGYRSRLRRATRNRATSAVGSGGVGVALINALKAWLATRARQVTIEIETRKGRLKIKSGTPPGDEVWKTLGDILRDSDD